MACNLYPSETNPSPVVTQGIVKASVALVTAGTSHRVAIVFAPLVETNLIVVMFVAAAIEGVTLALSEAVIENS